MGKEPPLGLIMTQSQIPIQNLYYLLCYAWDRLDQGSLVDVSRIPSTELVDLFATVLVKGVEHLVRRGFELRYSPQEEQLRGIRGRIDMLSTQRRFLVQHGRAACLFDELTTNTLPNQILKATLRALATDPAIDRANRTAVLRIARELSNVEDIALTSQSFRRVQLTGNNRFYRFLLNICELVHGAWLTSEEEGHYRFRSFLRDEKRMALVFQYFVYNFLRIERSDLTVFRENINWKADSNEDAKLSLLPEMRTDISVINADRKLIIDTKYYRETLSEYYGSRKIHSQNLYQLLSYLLNVRQGDEKVEGVLLYPTVDQSLRITYSILGIPVTIQTLDLARPWRAIHEDIMQLPN
jgi:5-methylcytosine-specific restriction enzyme subunit McrC